ncbi:MAG TPA: glycosyltransferase family 2 protein [Sphingobacteriaceae bacterium]|nr:glycosyltransferase family 2 protein [Sphingobacteriaceae bacterium]
MIQHPKVAVVILNWNGRIHLEQFLPSVYNSSYPNLELIIGDNASTDSSISFLKENFPLIRIIANDKNYGFAEGYNQVLTHVDADYFILLNSDVEVTPGWVEPVIALMEKDKMIAAAQPKIRSFLHKENFEYAGAAGGFIDKYGYPFCRGRIFDNLEKDHGQYDQTSEIFWASGAALFIRKECWLQSKGFDSRFFAHMEEIDLCWRLKLMGYKIMYCAQSSVYHLGGGTLNAENPYKTYLNFRNNLLMIKKNMPFFSSIYILFIRLWMDLLSLIKFALEGKFRNARAINKAHIYFFKHLFAHNSEQVNAEQFNAAGLYPGSIVWQYFIKKKKKFSDIF